MQKFFAILIPLFLFGCKDTSKEKINIASQDTTIKSVKESDTLTKTKVLTEEERESKKNEYEKQQKIDSISLSKVLETALTYANQNKHKNSFHHEFEIPADDSSFTVTTQLSYGNLFSADKKHLVVRRTIPWGTICNVFLSENDNFKNVCEREQFAMTYINDTLKDVNGDGFKDFLVHWYPSSGCCRRDMFNAYLYQKQTGRFTNDYEFINPTFSPSEKIIRGVEYRQPGEVGLYKYNWNGLQIDTIEFIYPYVNHKGKFIKVKTQKYRPTEKDGIILKSLPMEYSRIESIEWFLDY